MTHGIDTDVFEIVKPTVTDQNESRLFCVSMTQVMRKSSGIPRIHKEALTACECAYCCIQQRLRIFLGLVTCLFKALLSCEPNLCHSPCGHRFSFSPQALSSRWAWRCNSARQANERIRIMAYAGIQISLSKDVRTRRIWRSEFPAPKTSHLSGTRCWELASTRTPSTNSPSRAK